MMISLMFFTLTQIHGKYMITYMVLKGVKYYQNRPIKGLYTFEIYSLYIGTQERKDIIFIGVDMLTLFQWRGVRREA